MPPINSLVGVEFLAGNAMRRYPLTDDASGIAIGGGFTLPTELLLDLTLPVASPPAVDPSKVHISELAIFGDELVLKLAVNGGATVAVAAVSASSHSFGDTYPLVGVGDWLDSVGRVAIGDLTTTLAAAGVHLFNLAGARVLPTLIRPSPRGVRGLAAVNGSDVSDPLEGLVYMVAGSNIRLTPLQINPSTGAEVVDGTLYNAIRVDAIASENLADYCDCDQERQLAPPIRRIGGVAPTTGGDLYLQGTACLAVTTGEASVTLTNVCSTPCCGSAELDRLREDQQNLNMDVRTMASMIDRLETAYAQLNALSRALEASGVFVA